MADTHTHHQNAQAQGVENQTPLGLWLARLQPRLRPRLRRTDTHESETQSPSTARDVFSLKHCVRAGEWGATLGWEGVDRWIRLRVNESHNQGHRGTLEWG